jgi:S-disulfanyl-L-cysteine oxidoreductase SoxD
MVDWSERITLLVVATVLDVCGWRVGVAAESGATPPSGKTEFASHCAGCHGAVLEGGQHAPALSGPGFQANWRGKSARSLYSRIISTMPQDSPGSLTPAQALSITVFLFDENGIALGERPITSANDLNHIIITAQPSAP